jgi:cell division protein FtsZ
MIQFDLPKEQSSIIKVIGVGGGGSNAVNYMHSLDIGGVDFIVCNTDAQALSSSRVPNKIQLGPSLTQGLGAGANPEIGRQATEESLNEIRKILEVNTKMAFVTAGMGGGTGTGGAPIIAKICRDMGILTVGIVTTPFSYEGKKRALYAAEGIKELKSCVDTLLVISNDKLRHQFGNLTMSAALSTADNVLATAAKCITDVINTTGQINVDFADVCTVMRNGGVAILGSARAKGQNRAQTAIEQALNSPLLNDNDIRGAQWILININSKAGVTEFTMDEVETIQQFLLAQAGEDTDIILGLGYDETLGEDISITIIATGFEQKSSQVSFNSAPKEAVKDDRIMLTLETTTAAKTTKEIIHEVKEEPLDKGPVAPIVDVELGSDETPIVLELGLQMEEKPKPVFQSNPVAAVNAEPSAATTKVSTPSIPSSGFLVKPSIIYVTPDVNIEHPQVTAHEQKEVNAEINSPVKDNTAAQEEGYELVFHQEKPTTQVKEEVPVSMPQPNFSYSPIDEAEAQKAKAAERLYKLRNLSFNFNASDPNNEYEHVPAYVRQNLQMQSSSIASVEKFYSSYSVGTDEDNTIQISTINTFLEGKKPD